MTPELTTSSTLQRAAKTERERLERARQRLLARQEVLTEELGQLTRELEAIDKRRELLLEFATREDPSESAPAAHDKPVLKGAAIRERAARAFFLAHGTDTALHYRRWFELLLAEGVEVAGKDPMATFLTNLNRSPVVTRGTDAGTYAIDGSAPARLRQGLSELQAELRDLSGQISREEVPVGWMRENAARLTSEIQRVESLVAEADRVFRSDDADVSVETHERQAA